MTTASVYRTLQVPDFARLGELLDPQNWQQLSSRYWVVSQKVRLNPDGEFVPDPTPPGRSWNGYLYEYFQFPWNEYLLTAAQVYLNIEYEVHPDPDPLRCRITTRFWIHSCQGFLNYMIVTPSGLDVDDGFMTVSPLANRPPGWFEVCAQKRIRFAPVLDRRPVYRSMPGAHNILNYLLPAVVELWMEDFVDSILR